LGACRDAWPGGSASLWWQPQENGERHDRHALALEPELIEHGVDAAMQYLETEWWLEGVGGPRLELVDSTRRLVVPCPGDCGRGWPDGKAMCELCWQHVPGALRKALFRAWHRRQRGPSNPEWREQYRLVLDLCMAAVGETI
jgi:hypothetical protein